MRSLYQDMLNRSYNTLFPACVQWPKLLKKVTRFVIENRDFKCPDIQPQPLRKCLILSMISNWLIVIQCTMSDTTNTSEICQPIDLFLTLFQRLYHKSIFDFLCSRLVRVRLLSKKDIDNQEAIAQAKSIYDTKYGLSAD